MSEPTDPLDLKIENEVLAMIAQSDYREQAAQERAKEGVS